MGFSRQEYWSGLSFPPPGNPPDPEIEPGAPALLAHSLPYEPQDEAGRAGIFCIILATLL